MAPAVGQLWRAPGGSLYRVRAIDLGTPGDCVELGFEEPGEWLEAEWETDAERSVEWHRAETEAHPLMVELAWFERSGTFVREAA